MRNELSLLILLTVLCLPTFARDRQTNALFPVTVDDAMERDNNRMGFIDSKGKLVIGFKFYYASELEKALQV
jgi:hypothetical protein